MQKPTEAQIREKLDLLVSQFGNVLYAADTFGLENLEKHNLAGDDTARYTHWEWPQGIGLFGIWKLYEKTGNKALLQQLVEYYDARIAEGLPARNVNTTAPVLTLSYLAEHIKNESYMQVCTTWAEWVMNDMARTEEGGLQHITSESANTGELWDDTLMMTVLMLANMGRILGRQDYIDEAVYQFLLHEKYLADRRTNLWFHGFTFEGRHNFVNALWGRGNSWITIAIPIFLEMVPQNAAVRRYLQQALERQVAALQPLQTADGMWHTLLDKPDSYPETSCTSGFGYGILRGIHIGLLPESYRPMADAALAATLRNIDNNGVVQNVSYGTPMGKDSQDFYRNIPIRPMPYGHSMALLLLMEALGSY